jgi:hypothetical protein
MPNWRRLLAAFVVVLLGAPVLALAADDFGSDTTDITSIERQKLVSDYPGVHLNVTDGRLMRAWGTRITEGGTAEAAAAAFVNNYSNAFGVPAKDLQVGNIRDASQRTQPVMIDRATGNTKFNIVYYSHNVEGVPVFRSELRILTRNDSGNPVVWSGSSLRGLGSFVPTAISPNAEVLGRAAVATIHPNLVNFTQGRKVIFAGSGDMVVAPRMGIEFIADNGMRRTASFEKYLFVTDALTGEILFKESQIHYADVTGNVNGMATQGIGADICHPEALENFKYARVNVQSSSSQVFTDANGNYVFPLGTTAVTLESQIRGNWFRVFNDAGAETILTTTTTPPSVVNFTHNAANTSEFNRAEVNGYIEANVVRDFALLHSPGYPVIATQTEFETNVNIASSCNAFYDGSSINFYRAGGGCPNMANETIIHHEYGHHLVGSAGSLQGAYGEGMSDCMGVLITDQPILALGFFNDCNSGLRNADNTKQYPCSGEIHDCGQLLSGCVWDTRNALAVTNPGTYRDIIADLTVNSILLHVGSDTIAPDITTDFYTLDDDDGDISNGTPHKAEIDEGFGAHNMIPDLSPVSCSDIRRFQGQCRQGAARWQIRVFSTIDDGKPVSILVDGTTTYTVNLNNAKALFITGLTGTHTAAVSQPAGCGVTPVTITCP